MTWTLLQDLEYGWRRLVRQPGFTAVAVLALALGIGGTTAIWSLLDGVVLRPLPYKEPRRMVQIWATAPALGLDRTELSVPRIQALAAGAHAFAGLAASRAESFTLTDQEDPVLVQGERISDGFFDVWAIEPLLGRRFLPAEQRRGGPDVVLLSHGLWRRRYHGDPHVLGRVLRMAGKSATIVGVMPESLRYPFREIDLWAPRVDEPGVITTSSIDRGAGFLDLAARLRPGIGIAEAQAEVDAVSRRYRAESPALLDSPWDLQVVPLQEALVGDLRPSLLLLLGAIAFVLLIACADVGNLLLAQALTRRREIAIRSVMGAGRRRIVRQLLVEGVLLAVLGAAAGLVLAYWGLRLLVAANPGNLPRIETVGLDAQALALALTLSLLTGTLCALAPALQVSRLEPREALRDGDRGATGGLQRSRIQALFVVSEVALALMLMIGAGLLVQSLRNLRSVDPGFRSDHLLTLPLTLPRSKYPTTRERAHLFEELRARALAIPGIESAAVVDFPPIQGALRTHLGRLGDGLTTERRHLVFRLVATPGYFHTLLTRMPRGHDFELHPADGAPRTAVVNRALAAQFFPGENPLGARLLVGAKEAPVEVVGVVDDIRADGLTGPAGPSLFLSSAEVTDGMDPLPFANLLVRTRLPPGELAKALRTTVRAVDPEQPVGELQTMEQVIAVSIAGRRLTTSLLAGFSAIALLLSVLGVYGIVAHSVSLRRKEIGIRVALGARRGHVLATVTGRGLRLIGWGIGLGLLGAAALGRILASQLFEVSALDPLYLTTTPALLALVAVGACCLPVRQATRIAPAATLKGE
ncbi:MAG: ABC transporter permease [Acidobacteriota bacterium]|nr:ABC transporter permease [Acidobacteriota bacterium]